MDEIHGPGEVHMVGGVVAWRLGYRPIWHGSPRGAQRHRDSGTTICRQCLDAENAERRARAKRRPGRVSGRTCPECGFKTKTGSGMSSHMRVHESKEVAA